MSETGASGPPGGIAFDGKRFKVRVRTLSQPVGGITRFEIVETPAAAAVVPVLAEGGADGDPLVVLVEQERPAVGRRTLEIPAGLVDAHPGGADAPEQPEQTARRELEEETGYQAPAGSLRLLTHLFTSPGICDEVIHIYLASGIPAQRVRGGPADPSEIAGVRMLPLGEAVAAIARGEIQDAKTIAGLLLARDVLRGSRDGSSQAPSTDGGTDRGASMPADPTNMPQGAIGNDPVSGAKPSSLTAENILTQEFGYANITAYQAQEDRARFFGLYLTLVGILAAALGAVAQLGGSFNRELLLPVASLLLALAGLLGIIFFTLLIRLRQAWFGSAVAMNTIKKYYVEQLKSELPDIDKAFHWKFDGIPAGGRIGSPTFIVCYTTAAISSFCMGVAVGIFGAWIASNGWIQHTALVASLGIAQPWLDLAVYGAFAILGLLVFAIAMRRYIRYFSNQLATSKQEAVIKQEEEVLEGQAVGSSSPAAG
jgi:ADP-ribose pyrophosphatase